MSTDEDALQKRVHRSSPSLLEKLGAGTDALLENFFYWWGRGELQGVSEFSSTMKCKLPECACILA
jgi:hypothetical protein